MASQVTLKALGLNSQPNQLEVPEGSLTIAKNVIIERDDVLQSRRGFKIYGDSLGTSTDRAKQLAIYKERILRHFTDKLEFDNGSGTFTAFCGSYLETEPGLRIKSIESNGNYYFTTADGIKKISSKDADAFTSTCGYITNAGGIKAIDLTSTLKYVYGNQSGFFTQDGAVAYRVVWGIRDANNNLILGTPSQRSEIYNPLLTLLLRDFNHLLGNLDNLNQAGSLITDGDYVSTLYLPITFSSQDLQTNLLALASKLDNDILYADNVAAAPLQISTATITGTVATINFSSGDPTQYFVSGSNIFLSDFTPTTGTLDGAQVVASVTSTTITFNTTATGPVVVGAAATIVSNEYRTIQQPPIPSTPSTDQELVDLQTYLSLIQDRLLIEPVAVISAPLSTEFVATLDITTTATVILNISVPQEVTTNNFYQIYRSPVAVATGAAVLSTDVFPTDEMQLVFEGFPTQAEIDAGVIIIEDITPDSFRGANLYTNPSTGEGILQANDVPPFAKDINRFKNYVFYANTKTRHRKSISLIGVQNMIDDFNNSIIPKLTIADEDSFSTYSFIVGEAESTDITTGNGASLVSAAAPGSYFLINNAENQTKYYVWYQIGSSTDPMISGRTGIEVIALTGNTSTEIAEKTRDKLNVLNAEFSATSLANVITVTLLAPGYTDDVDAGTSGFTINTTNQGTGEKVTRESSTFTTVADVAGSLAGKYFTVNTAFNVDPYYIWFKVAGVGVDPAPVNKTGLLVNLATNDSATVVASKIALELNTNYNTKFIASSVTSALTINNYRFGEAADATVGTSGFTLVINEQGALQVLLSTNVSPAQAVTITSNSLVRVINRNLVENVYAYYISGAQDVPGQILLEARNLSNGTFYLVTNNSTTGLSFNPDLSPDIQISSISVGDPNTMLVTTSTPHGLTNLDYVIIDNSNSISSIDGFHQITYVSPTTFRLNVTIYIAGTQGSLINANNAEFSSNEEAKNRVYYSKLQQPEAVPILNYLDVGANDKEILRIFPLRDSLFVFKEDGLYRISGESIPFNLALFDGSCILVAPDSLAAVDNIIYGWTRRGIASVTESTVRNISRPIDVDLLPLSSSNYPNFKTATWGTNYESDNAYIVFTVTKPSDTVATQAYRYSTLTNTFTTFTKTNTCGIVNVNGDDKMYLGAGDINFLEQERKSFSRLDYADRQYDFDLIANNYLNNEIILLSVENIKEDDILVQEQTVTVYDFNMLLKKLDIDPNVSDTNYFSTLKAQYGSDMRAKLVALANKLDADPGVFDTDYAAAIASLSGSITDISAASPSIITTSVPHGLLTGRNVAINGSDSTPLVDGNHEIIVLSPTTFSIDFSVTIPGTTGTYNTVDSSFSDLLNCYNIIIDKLNQDAEVAFSNYMLIEGNTFQETRITKVNIITKTITIENQLEFVVGPLIVFKGINCMVQYSPATMQDPLGLKHMREATVMFQSQAFTKATVSFASDLLPRFIPVDFFGDNNGTFGNTPFGEGFFGGASNSVPMRTYIPRDVQRCRYLVVKYTHSVAREIWAIYGITLTGEVGLSTRAFR